MKGIILLILFVLYSSLYSDDYRAYRIFDKNGQEVIFENILEGANNSEVVLFGEHHTNPICHWLQLELVKSLHTSKEGNIIIGSEIFEADDQIIINEYMDSLISYTRFKGEAKLWKSFKTDYKPIFDFAFDNNLKFIATNVPRRYASMVAKKGYSILDSITPAAKSFISPAPYLIDTTLPGYSKMAEMFGPEMSHKASFMMRAQALKDQTMAHNIYINLEQKKTFIHINGAYHNLNYEGIIWYLKQKNKDMNILSIVTVSQENVNELEKKNIGLGDFIIAIPNSMTTTY